MEGGAADDADADEFRGAFAVAHDELGELLREGGEGVEEGEPVGGGERGDFLAAGGAVGEEGDGVVGGHVAVDGDGVEGPIDGVGEEFGEGGRRYWDVGGEDAEEGGHVRVDHAGAFGHAGERIGRVRGRGEREGLREKFGKCVGGADGAGSGKPGFVVGGDGGVGGGDPG